MGECTLTFKDVNKNLISFKQKVFGGYVTKRDIQHQKLNFTINENGDRFLEREK